MSVSLVSRDREARVPRPEFRFLIPSQYGIFQLQHSVVATVVIPTNSQIVCSSSRKYCQTIFGERQIKFNAETINFLSIIDDSSQPTSITSQAHKTPVGVPPFSGQYPWPKGSSKVLCHAMIQGYIMHSLWSSSGGESPVHNLNLRSLSELPSSLPLKRNIWLESKMTRPSTPPFHGPLTRFRRRRSSMPLTILTVLTVP